MIPLHCHTDASNGRLIDSVNKVEKLIDRAVSLQYPGLAITDHETVSNHVRAIKYVNSGKKKGNIPQDFKLILGNEIYLVDEILKNINGSRYCDNYYHFILLAKDSIGHRQLRELSSGAWDNSFYTGKMERVPTLKKELERVVKADPGHLIACTACVGGEIGKRILNYSLDNSDLPFYDPKAKEKYNREQREKIANFLDYCLSLFGDDFYLELQPNDSMQQMIVNTELMKIAKAFSIPVVITTDAHYLTKEDRMIHEAYLQSHEEEREVGDFYKTTYMMNTDEIHAYLDSQIGESEVKKALVETLNVGNKVENYDLYHPTIVPGADVPEFELSHFFGAQYKEYEYIAKFAYSINIYDQYLLKLIEDGYIKRIPYNALPYEKYLETVQRINDECMEMWLVTEKLGTSISSYYLSTLELIDIMWNEGDSLVGVARGSVTGMFTMYLIGLIQMNPIQWGLPYWRHISHFKVELSDVDIDTQANRRTQIIEAVKKRKGERKVLNCCTFKTEKANSAILAAGRGLGIDPDITSYIAGMIPVTRGESWSINDCLNGNVEEERRPIKQFSDECKKYPGLLEVALGIEGLICGRSIHASAVYLFNEDFLEHNARMKAPNGTYITQFNMKDSDYQSGLKMDFLTIEALDKIRTCMDLLVANRYMEWQGSLRATYDKYLHPDVLDYDTREMWDWISENKVPDLFQFDTQMGLQAARRIKPHSLIELAAANSIMRLMVSGEGAEQPIDTYIRFKNDINQWYSLMRKQYHLTDNEICTVEVYLKPLYGVGDTQEVVMEISMDQKIAAFNVKESNLLRKGISKKDKDLQAEMKKMFFERGHEIGTSNNLLDYIWNEVVGKQLG